MDSLILSHFDAYIGPRIFLKAPESIYNEEFEQIPKLMDVYDSGFVIQIYKDYPFLIKILEV